MQRQRITTRMIEIIVATLMIIIGNGLLVGDGVNVSLLIGIAVGLVVGDLDLFLSSEVNGYLMEVVGLESFRNNALWHAPNLTFSFRGTGGAALNDAGKII